MMIALRIECVDCFEEGQRGAIGRQLAGPQSDEAPVPGPSPGAQEARRRELLARVAAAAQQHGIALAVVANGHRLVP